MKRKFLGLRNKKGDATDVILIMILAFFLAVSFILVTFTNTKLQNIIQTTEFNSTAAAPDILNAFDTINTTTVQRGFVLMFALLIIGIMASSFLIRVHPVFIFIYIFTLSIAIFSSVFLANTFQAIIENPTISATVAGNQDMINFVMQHIISIILGVGALSMIIIFSKVFRGTGGGELGDL